MDTTIAKLLGKLLLTAASVVPASILMVSLVTPDLPTLPSADDLESQVAKAEEVLQEND